MGSFTRREFLKAATVLAAHMGLGGHYRDAIAAGLEKILDKKQPVLWLQGQACSGCSVSFLNADSPGPLDIVTQFLSLVFHSTISAAQGDDVLKTIDKAEKNGNFALVVEGSIPLDIPEACIIGNRTFSELLPPLLKKAAAVFAVGTCASYGGIPAAEGNLTGAMSVQGFMERESIPYQKRLVNLPSCPVHPESVVGTLAYVVGTGYPPVDETLLTPTMFYGASTHDECPRFHSWEKEVFAEKFGEPEGCLFKLGCLGPISYTDCPRRQWNGGINWCIRASAPCIACTSPIFSKTKSFPFYRKGEKYHSVDYQESERKGKVS